MDIFLVTSSRFSQASTITTYHASEREAIIAATERVNSLRANLDSQTLPPVHSSSWQLGLVGAQLLQLKLFGSNTVEVDHKLLADSAGFDVRIEKVELRGMSVLAFSDRELSTVLAALRDYQRRSCPPDLADVASNLNRHKPLTADEIDDLCMRINDDTPLPLEANIVVTLDGGLIQGIAADRPITVRVVDHDVEGADPDDLVMVPQDQGEPIPASVSSWAMESICIDPEWITSLDAAIALGNQPAALMTVE